MHTHAYKHAKIQMLYLTQADEQLSKYKTSCYVWVYYYYVCYHCFIANSSYGASGQPVLPVRDGIYMRSEGHTVDLSYFNIEIFLIKQISTY